MFEHEGEICNCNIGGNMTPDWIRVSGKRLVSINKEVRDEEETSSASLVPVIVRWQGGEHGGEHGFEDITEVMHHFGLSRRHVRELVYSWKHKKSRFRGKFIFLYGESDRKDNIPK